MYVCVFNHLLSFSPQILFCVCVFFFFFGKRTLSPCTFFLIFNIFPGDYNLMDSQVRKIREINSKIRGLDIITIIIGGGEKVACAIVRSFHDKRSIRVKAILLFFTTDFEDFFRFSFSNRTFFFY